MTKFHKPFTIGLDLGTGSVGYAVIDGEYKLLKLNGKHAWGSVLFENAQTAKARRLFRSARRRFERRRERIRLLQMLLEPMLVEDDPGFLARLKDSAFVRGEGEFFRSNRYNLFDGDFTDKDYFEKYPTIYHLRKELMTSSEKADPRLIYLAIHHIVKYRGHFLDEGQSIDAGGANLQEALNKFFEELVNNDADMHYIGKVDRLAQILKDKSKPRAVRLDEAVSLFSDSGYKKYAKVAFGAMLGYTVGLSDVADAIADAGERNDDVIVGDDGKTLKFSFASSDYAEKEEGYVDALEDKQELFYKLKEVYTAVMYDVILRGKRTISEAMIDRWEKHGKDLRALKNVFAANMTKEQYKAFFNEAKDVNYVRYIGDKSKGWFKDRVSAEDFCKQVEKLLEEMPDSEEKAYCLEEIEKEDFLPLINSTANSYIPYQFNEKELAAIIDKQSGHYPLLAQEKSKIVSLLTFRRPYYVGPLKGDKFGWCEQKIDGVVTPWNFEEKVDMGALAEKFITRMTSKCSIFPQEDALPRNSITYQAFAALNELNKVKLRDREPLPVEWKKEMFLTLCCKKRKVSKKDIAVFLRRKYNEPIEEEAITGMAEDRLTATMTALCDFKSKLKEDFDKSNLDAYEESIRILTIFEDKKVRTRRLEAQGIYTEEQVNKLSGLRYSGWGSYSRKALIEVRGNDGKSVLETMFDTNMNFNEVRFDKELGFAEEFNGDDGEVIEQFAYDDVKDLRCSPIVKQSVWNALRVVDEICEIAGDDPDAIYLETTFEEKDKKATKSRVQALLELYKSIKKDAYFNKDCEEKLKVLDKRDRLDDDKFFLWLQQLGKCMYTGQPISFDELGNCQIDHIVPRSVVANDSLSNKVLVITTANQTKGDRLGMDPDVVKKMLPLWDFLYKKHFIGSKKFYALQKTRYEEDDLKGFVNRQLVDTSYTIRLVRELLEKRFPNARIGGIRQSLNHAMRMKYAEEGKAGFYKIRSLNDMHHAKDAYLTAVMGQFKDKGCPTWGSICKMYLVDRKDVDRQRGQDVEKAKNGIVLGLFERHQNINQDGEVVWDEPFRINVFKTMASNDCIVVKKLKRRAESAFYDQTLYSPRSDKKKLMPQKYRNGKPMPPEIYGGFSSRKPAYYAIVEYEKKGQKKYSFTEIPVIVDCADNVENFIKNEYGASAKVVRYVYKFQLIEYKGQRCYITGKMELNNACQLIVDGKFEKLIWLVEHNALSEIEASFDKYQKVIEEFIPYYSGKLRKYYPIVAKFADILDWIASQKLQSMTAKQQVELVKKMISLTAPGPGVIKIETAEGKEEPVGRLCFNIFPEQVTWIDRSITGLRERVRKGV